MIKCAIIDDEPLALSLLENYIEKTPMLELCGKYESAVQAMGELTSNPVDLIFLDIQMPGLTGLDFSRMIDTHRTRIVITTAFSQYAIEGYKVNALDYLLKPISYTDFIASVSRAQQWFCTVEGNAAKAQNASASATASVAQNATAAPAAGSGETAELLPHDYFFVKSEHKMIRIRFDHILYVEGLKDYVKLHLADGAKPILSLMSMRAVEAALPSDRFFRIHRSFIVNIDKVEVFERGQIQIGGKHIPISDSYKEQVQNYVNAALLPGSR